MQRGGAKGTIEALPIFLVGVGRAAAADADAAPTLRAAYGGAYTTVAETPWADAVADWCAIPDG